VFSYYFKSDSDSEFITLDKPRPGCWIHVDQAVSSDISEISTLTGVEHADIYDALDKHEIPRVEMENNEVIVFARTPIDPQSGLYTSTLTVLLTKDYIITISPHQSMLVQTILGQKPQINTQDKTKFLLYLLLKMTQAYTRQIKKIRSDVLMQEKDLARIESEDIISLTRFEENLNQYSSSLLPMRNVLEDLARGKYIKLSEEDENLLDDLMNASIQSEDLCTVNLLSIRSLRDSYQIIFTNQLNKTIKLLTALTIILSMPTVVASLYGMNVKLPFASLNSAFILILVFIALISYLSLLVFKKKKWL